MSYDNAIPKLNERLGLNRNRLRDLLDQQARFGSAYTPPHILADIRDARRDILEIKADLRQLGTSPVDLPEDTDPAVPPPPPNDSIGSGVEIFEQNPRYTRLHRTTGLDQLIHTVFSSAGYHLIEAPMGHGKTALAGEIWRSAGQARYLRLAYLFSRDHGRARISQAMRSLHLQLRSAGAPTPPLREEEAVSINALYHVVRHTGPLIIILDGIDECDDSERPLLRQLLPEGVIPGVTVVVTLRPALRHLLRHLPMTHTLQGLEVAQDVPGVRLHRLHPLSMPEIANLLHLNHHSPDPELAERIYHYSQGLPVFAVPYIEQPNLLSQIRTGVVPVDAYYERVLEQMRTQCQDEQQTLLRQMLAMLAAAHSAMSLDELGQILEINRSQSLVIRDLFARYQQLDDTNTLGIERHFREHLARAETLGDAVAAAEARLARWVESFIDATDLNKVPLYALRHAAEYLAASPNLYRVLIRVDWFGELERRCRSRSSCIEAIKLAQQAIDQQFTGQDGDPTIVNMILCALMRASFGATLLPELVAQLVRLEFWGEAEAIDYAENYTSPADRQALLSLLAHPQRHPSLPSGSAVAEAAALLERYTTLPLAARQSALVRWRRDYEQASGNSNSQADRDLLDRLIDALRQPPLSGGKRASPSNFTSLLVRLSSYQDPLTGPMRDPLFTDLIAQIADIWWQLRPRDSHTIWLHQIMAALTRFARADLLEALELLAPALRTLFPLSVTELCDTLDALGTALMAE